MPKYQVLKVAEVLDHGESDQGLRVGVKVRDEAGTECVILLPHEAAGAFFTRLQAGAEHARKTRAQHGHASTAEAYTMAVESIGMGVLSRGDIALRVRLSGGMKLDLPIPRQSIPGLLDALERAVQASSSPPTSDHKH